MDRPKCRCAERRAAVARAATALARGDLDAWRRETTYVRQTLAEDVQAHRDWLVSIGKRPTDVEVAMSETPLESPQDRAQRHAEENKFIMSVFP